MFAKDDKPSLFISTLDALAVLAALNCSTQTPRTSSVSVSRSSRRGRTTGERNCAQPAHVHQVPFFRGHHGACSLHDEGLDQGARGVVAPVRQRGGRLAGQWELRRVQPEPTLPTWTGCFSRKLSRSDVQLNRISRMRKPESTALTTSISERLLAREWRCGTEAQARPWLQDVRGSILPRRL